MKPIAQHLRPTMCAESVSVGVAGIVSLRGPGGVQADVGGCDLVRSFAPKSRQAAHAWLRENARKPGPALILRTPRGTYYVGAWCGEGGAP